MAVKYQKKVMRILNSRRMVSKNNKAYFNVFGETVNIEPDNTEVNFKTHVCKVTSAK